MYWAVTPTMQLATALVVTTTVVAGAVVGDGTHSAAAAAPPPPPKLYLCGKGFNCVESPHGLPLDQCQQICKLPGPPGPAPPPPPGPRPHDSPCLTWRQADCDSIVWPSAQFYLPAIVSAWQWYGHGACGTPTGGGSCSKCDGDPASLSCGYKFPCFNAAAQTYGHTDVTRAMSLSNCFTSVPGSNVSDQSCPMWIPGKGPQCDQFGWQVAQKGARPSQAIGQLVTHTKNCTTFVLARTPSAAPFQNCGAGTTGWVELAEEGTLGCFNAAVRETHFLCAILYY
jgi:hypothetical protein